MENSALSITKTPISLDALLARVWGCGAMEICLVVVKPPCRPLEVRVLDKPLLEDRLVRHLGDCWAMGIREGRVEVDEPLAALAAPCGKPLQEILSEVLGGQGVTVKCL